MLTINLGKMPEKIYLSASHVSHLLDAYHIDTPSESGDYLEYVLRADCVEDAEKLRAINDYAIKLYEFMAREIIAYTPRRKKRQALQDYEIHLKRLKGEIALDGV